MKRSLGLGLTSLFFGLLAHHALAATASVLAAFQFDNTLGQFPAGPLAVGTDGYFYGVTTSGAANDYGAAFKVSSSGIVTKLLDFDATVIVPFGLAFGSDGNLFGVSTDGSVNGSFGSVFKITLGNSPALQSFAANGSSPHAPLVLGSDGNLYGTTEESGPGDQGTVFRVSSGGTITRLSAFPGPFVTPAIGAYPAAALAEGTPGTFYGTTINGANGTGTIYVATSGGGLSLLYTFTATDGNGHNSDGSYPNELVKGNDGNLYGTTQYGGTTGFGTIFRITPAGAFSVLYTFDGVQAGSPTTGLVKANDGNFYGSTGYIGAGNEGVFYKITPSGNLTMLTTLDGDIAGASRLVQGPDGKFYCTSSVAGATNAGTVFVVDAGLPSLQGGTPTITTQPVSQAVAAGQPALLDVAATGASNPGYQWQLNGIAISGATHSSLTLADLQPGDAGLYNVVVTGSTSTASAYAIVGPATTSAVIDSGSVVGTNITAPNGNHYDQVLLTGPAEAIATQGGRITRTSYIDLNGDIVQVEFSGHGTLSLVLDDSSGPAIPVNYNQPTVSYMKGHAGLVIVGADESTNVLVFTVGRATAFDPTGHYNILLPISATNVPAHNGSSLFVGHDATVYTGIADLSFIAIASTDGKFGGLRASDATFYATAGCTGVYAPGVAFQGPVYLGNIDAHDSATPVIMIGSTSDARITGGSLAQTNGAAVQVSGLTQLKFTAGTDSAGNLLPAQDNQAVLEENGQNVTSGIVVNPTP